MKELVREKKRTIWNDGVGKVNLIGVGKSSGLLQEGK